jgi:serine/threonine protein kinase
MFGDGRQPLDALVVPIALDAIAALADTLTALHRGGQAHRGLSGDSVLVTTKGRRGALRDLGSAWWPRRPGEGGRYRAPEQQAIAAGRPGPHTDLFQLSALLQHTCTGFQPAAGRPIPLRTFVPAVPDELDTLLAAALDPDPARRPNAGAFAAGLRQARQHLLSRGTA